MEKHYWIHDFSPFIFEINGFGPRWYGLAYILGFVCGAWIFKKLAEKRMAPLYPSESWDHIMYCAIGTIVGARIGYCLFYNIESFITFTSSVPFWKVLAVNEGGMSSHGGVLGLMAMLFIASRKKKRNMLALYDITTIGTTAGVVFGRLANFINGELWGRVTDVSWAMKFPDSTPGGIPNEIVKHSKEWYDYVALNCPARHPSQLYAVFLEGLIPLVVTLLIHRKHKTPGITVASVFIIYGINRFIGEFWRQPDVGYDLYFNWMSKGQALSIPMIIVGIALLIFVIRKGRKEEAYLDPKDDPEIKKQNKK